ncbi:hypothetical protein, partial [Acinetobacter baumannii]|uniref:hypothetical protein n=1 Tax=Acinetobacter baumannii TaxID=470 RepID=UPI001BB469C4
MTTFKWLGAAAVRSALSVSQAQAQAVVQEPGLFAFYQPNGDVLHAGSSRPAAEAQAMAPRPMRHH